MKAFTGRMPQAGAGICLLFACLLAGCFWDRPDATGVVAEVNGAPIRLAELEARHDAGRLGIPVLENPAVEELRTEYGAVLADMIVTRLMVQELDRLKLSPSPADLAEAEAVVRADYPGDAFERMLLEEHIDLTAWRTMLAERLALEKFSRDVLRPTVRVGVSEAASYYKDHIDAFARPASVRLLVVTGPDAEAVKAALAAARKSGQGESAPGVAQAVLPEAGLPAGWRDALKGRKPGEASQPLPSGREYVGLILLERLPAAVLDPAKAYARVEAMLAAEKLDKAFAAWLAETLGVARVRVNRQLLATAGQPDGPQAPQAAVGPGPTELETARAEDAARTYVLDQARKTLADKRAAAGSPTEAGDPPSPAPVDVLPASGVAEGQPAATPIQDAPSAPAQNVAETTAGQPAAAPAQTVAASPPSVPDPPSAPVEPAQTGPAAPEVTPAPTPNLAEATPPVVRERDSAPAASSPATAPGQPGDQAAASALAPQPTAPAYPPADATDGSPTAPLPAQTGPGEVEFTAVKASWILYTVDESHQERVYLKPGKPLRLAYARRLVVRLGSPSVVTCRAGGRETTLDVGQKESRVLEFP
ncbi:MAG: peptidyl-prolyl cis-trans isomerase [Acidobacteriota bacterium]